MGLPRPGPCKSLRQVYPTPTPRPAAAAAAAQAIERCTHFSAAAASQRYRRRRRATRVAPSLAPPTLRRDPASNPEGGSNGPPPSTSPRPTLSSLCHCNSSCTPADSRPARTTRTEVTQVGGTVPWKHGRRKPPLRSPQLPPPWAPQRRGKGGGQVRRRRPRRGFPTHLGCGGDTKRGQFGLTSESVGERGKRPLPLSSLRKLFYLTYTGNPNKSSKILNVYRNES